MDELVRNFFENILSDEQIQVIYEDIPLSTIDKDRDEYYIIDSIIIAIKEVLSSPQTKDLSAYIRRAIGSKLLEFLNRQHKFIIRDRERSGSRGMLFINIFQVLSKLNCISLFYSNRENKNIKNIIKLFYDNYYYNDHITILLFDITIFNVCRELLCFDFNNQTLIDLLKYENIYKTYIWNGSLGRNPDTIRSYFENCLGCINPLIKNLKIASIFEKISNTPEYNITGGQNIPDDSLFIQTINDTIERMLNDAHTMMVVKSDIPLGNKLFKEICRSFGPIENGFYTKYINSYLNKVLTFDYWNITNFDINKSPELINICAKNHYYNLFIKLISIPSLDLSKINIYDLCSESVVYLNKVLEILKDYSDKQRLQWLRGVVGFKPLAYKMVNTSLLNQGTLLEFCLFRRYTKHSLALIEFIYTDLSLKFGPRKNKTYADLSNDDKSSDGLEVTRLLVQKGIVNAEDRIREQLLIEEQEYKQRVLQEKREVTTQSIKGDLSMLDDILNEPISEACSALLGLGESGTTCFQQNMCPFCLMLIVKNSPDECIYVSHQCAPKYRNENLLNLYFGDEWNEKEGKYPFGLCIECGRPVKGHSHYTHVKSDSKNKATEIPYTLGASHWRCNNKNGGGGKLERYCRVIGILEYLKNLMDTNQRIVKNPSLIRKLAEFANDSLYNKRIIEKASVFIETGDLNSTLKHYVKYNAPMAGEETNSNANTKEPNKLNITPYIYLKDKKELKKCNVCHYRKKILFKFHDNDKELICINCVKYYICSQHPSGNFDCPLGCTNLSSTIKNTIKKSDVENINVEIRNKASDKISNIPLCEYPKPDEDNDEDDSKEYDIRVF
jgi:hypothetical protein